MKTNSSTPTSATTTLMDALIGGPLVDLAQGAKPRSTLGGGSGIVGFGVALCGGFVDLRIEFSAFGQDGYRFLGDGQKSSVHRDTQIVLAVALDPDHRVVDQ